MKTNPTRHVVAAILVVILAKDTFAQSPSPVVEWSSILTSLDVDPSSGRLILEDDNAALSSAFLPAGSSVDVVISKAGDTRPLVTQPLRVLAGQGVFHRLGVQGATRPYQFTKAGDYVLTFRAGGVPMTVVPFSVELQTNDDEFDPKTFAYLNGPWDQQAVLFASVEKGSDAVPELRFWTRTQSFLSNPPAGRYTAEVRRGGTLLATSNGASSNSKKWQLMRLTLQHPPSAGGGPIRLGEIVRDDGTYVVTIKRDGQDHAVFQMDVRDGMIVPHPRQTRQHQPRTDYLLPRFPGFLGTLGNDSAGHLFWMDRTNPDLSNGSNPTAATEPFEQDLERWQWLPQSIDPNRRFRLTRTDVATRSDTGLAVGEDLIVFGTGFPTGVAYLRCGEQKPRSIPSAESFDSKTFVVCGTKVVLVQRNQLYVYDTGTNVLTEIPSTEISLYNPANGLSRASGFLVATINCVSEVTDRTVLKVLDVSGPEPWIIPIPNADYQDSEVTSLAMDAKNGNVALAVASRGKVYVSRVAEGATQIPIDLNEQGGVGSVAMHLEDDSLFYGDRTRRIRRLDLDRGRSIAVTEFPAPRAGDGYVVRKGRVVAATNQNKKGSRYLHGLTDTDQPVQNVPGSGDAYGNSGANRGMGGGAAIAIDKTVFLAGTPGDSIGVGEVLQTLTGDPPVWQALKDSQGEWISAAQVTTSMGLLAFKTTNADRKTVIGYATYGQRINPADLVLAERPSEVADEPTSTPPSKTPTPEISAQDKAFLDAMLASEMETAAPFLEALGDEAGTQRVMEGFQQVFENAGRPDLFEEFKRRSKLANPD